MAVESVRMDIGLSDGNQAQANQEWNGEYKDNGKLTKLGIVSLFFPSFSDGRTAVRQPSRVYDTNWHDHSGKSIFSRKQYSFPFLEIPWLSDVLPVEEKRDKMAKIQYLLRNIFKFK